MKKALGSRAKILGLLREQDSTVRDLATRLGLTNNAVRAHLVALQKEGLVRRGGLQTGTRKPHIVYALTENAIHAFPNAYGRLLRAFVAVLGKQLSPQTLMGYLRQLGRELARGPAQEAQGKSPTERRRIALNLLVALGGEPSLRTNDEAATHRRAILPIGRPDRGHIRKRASSRKPLFRRSSANPCSNLASTGQSRVAGSKFRPDA